MSTVMTPLRLVSKKSSGKTTDMPSFSLPENRHRHGTARTCPCSNIARSRVPILIGLVVFVYEFLTALLVYFCFVEFFPTCIILQSRRRQMRIRRSSRRRTILITPMTALPLLLLHLTQRVMLTRLNHSVWVKGIPIQTPPTDPAPQMPLPWPLPIRHHPSCQL